MEDALLIAQSEKLGDRYILPIKSMRACMMNIKIKNVQVIWTLHNLHYRVAETYAFTDLVTDSVRSVQSNTCGFQVHPVNVDLEVEINTKLAEYEDMFANLPEEGINNEFHASMVKLFNRLHDAHTFYVMFRVYFPVNFGSRMSADGHQVITLRYSESKLDPLGQLALAYLKV
jgi:hypothetical protein